MFTLKISEDTCAWDALVAESKQGTIFSDSRYLQSLGVRYTCYQVLTKHGEQLAGVAVIEDQQGMHIAPYAFTPHQGILFCRSVNEQPNQKRQTTEFRITEFLIDSLIERYDSFSMALSPAFTDIRPFSWHNYGNSNLPQFLIKTRYTGLLDLSAFQLDNYLQAVRTVRRQEFNKSSCRITESADIEQFISLYVETFNRQDIAVADANLALIKRICTASLELGYGRLSVALVDDKPASMSLFLFDSDCAYYLFGANDPAFRNSGASTRLMIENIQHFAGRDLRQLDFVGVNSPQRGDFKLSFNAVLRPYYEVQLERAAVQL